MLLTRNDIYIKQGAHMRSLFELEDLHQQM